MGAVRPNDEQPAPTLSDAELHLIGDRELDTLSKPRGNHFALRADNLDEWESHFNSIGQEYLPRRTRPDGALQLFVADPDGHHIELFTGP